MICKKCGLETIDGATYCGHCGGRIDGKILCQNCGQLNREEYAYCVYCGERIDGKSVCPQCGVAHEGVFCPTCGQASKPTTAKKKPASRGLFGKICDIVANDSFSVFIAYKKRDFFNEKILSFEHFI